MTVRILDCVLFRAENLCIKLSINQLKHKKNLHKEIRKEKSQILPHFTNDKLPDTAPLTSLDN
jgi:hypothetical protein